MIENLKEHDLIVLDLYSEKLPQWGDTVSLWYRPDGYGKHDWMYCMLLNFGGRVGLHGKMDRVVNSYYDTKAHLKGKTLKGVGATPEGIENNPMMYELLFELPWRNERFGIDEWLSEYAKGRYGKTNANINQAWDILHKSSYNCPDNYPGEGTTESVLCARPHLPLSKVSTWGWAKLYYDADMTRQAAKLLLDASEEFVGVNNFEYDLVDVLRQSIADKANILLSQISEAYQKKDLNSFKDLSDEFLNIIGYQDQLLSTRPEFSVGKWLEDAKSLSDIEENKRLYEWNARTLITVWGNRDASEKGGLHDYSHREWSGLLSGLYYDRWKLFFDEKIQELEGKEIPKIDFYKIENEWTLDNKIYLVSSGKEVIPSAKNIYKKVFELQ